MSQIFVTKRDGRKEPLDIDKLHKVVMWACEGLTGVSASEVELKSHIQFYNNIKTTEIQETLIKAAAELIAEDTPNYQQVAGRLVAYHLRKEVFGEYTPPHLYDHVSRVVAEGFYDEALLEWYSKDEWAEINEFIHHERDEEIVYIGMEQWRGKYLVRNRSTGQYYETPQFAYILIAAALFHSYDEETRLDYVRNYYDAISQFYISLPTPIMAGIRTPTRQFSSCVLIETGDSLKEINATASAVVEHVARRAGIGVGMGRVRNAGSPIRGGEAVHTGVFSYIHYIQAAINVANQGGLRKGSGTIWFPVWNLEIEDILVMKNNKGTEDNRNRRVDYGIQFNKLFYERLINGEDITLFSSSEVPGLADAFYEDDNRFREIYESAERNTHIRKKKIPAIDLFTLFVQERKDTGRIYLQNIDNVNNQGPFVRERHPITMSNLCAEIDLPTRPLQNVEDEDGEIALCILSAINMGVIRNWEQLAWACDLAVRGLDALIDYQSYLLPAAARTTLSRRTLGIGIVNLAYWLAKHDVGYSDESSLDLVDTFAQHWSYYLIQASCELSKEHAELLGPHLVKEIYQAEGELGSKYWAGEVPLDWRNKNVDELLPHKDKMPWDKLRADLKKYGIKNWTLMAGMPSETSSTVLNATNGFEPVRALVTAKGSKDTSANQVVPEIRRLKNKYEPLWDQQSPRGYLNICAIFQKYMDQGISVNTSYNLLHYEDEKLPLSAMIGDILHFYKYGGKQLYYNNTWDGAGEIEMADTPVKLVEQLEEEDCDACSI